MTEPHWKTRAETFRSEAALRAARSASEQSTYTALNAENIMLRQEVSALLTKFEASQLLADQAIKERDEWHRLAVESDRKSSRMAPVVAAAERLITEAQNGMWNSSITCDLIIRALLGLDPKTPRDVVIDVIEALDAVTP